MDTVKEHFHQMNHRSVIEGMNTVDTGMGEDRVSELEVVEREPEAWCRRTRRKWEELAKPGCSKGQPTFTTHEFNCSAL
jgi:hypothetical protein